MERLTQQEEEVMLYFWKIGPSLKGDRYCFFSKLRTTDATLV